MWKPYVSCLGLQYISGYLRAIAIGVHESERSTNITSIRTHLCSCSESLSGYRLLPETCSYQKRRRTGLRRNRVFPPSFTSTNFYTNQILNQPVLAPINSYTSQPFHQPVSWSCTKHLDRTNGCFENISLCAGFFGIIHLWTNSISTFLITPSMVMELVSGGVYRVYRTVFWPCSTVSDFLVCVIILMSSCWIICHKYKMCLKTMFWCFSSMLTVSNFISRMHMIQLIKWRSLLGFVCYDVALPSQTFVGDISQITDSYCASIIIKSSLDVRAPRSLVETMPIVSPTPFLWLSHCIPGFSMCPGSINGRWPRVTNSYWKWCPSIEK